MKPWLVQLVENLEQYSFLVLLLPLAVAARHWPRLPPAMRLLAGGLAVLLGLQLLLQLLPLRGAVEGSGWLLYTVVQTLFLGSLYRYTYATARPRQYLQAALLAFLAFALLDWGWLERGQHLYAYTHSLQSALMLTLAGLYLYRLSQQPAAAWLEHNPFFLVSSGIVMYFSGTVLVYVVVWPFISASDTLGQNVVALLVFVVALVQYCLFALAFTYAARPSSLPRT